MRQTRIDRGHLPKGHDFSPSSVKVIRQCHLRAKLRHVDKLPDPSGPDAAAGTLVHGVLEVVGQRRLDARAAGEFLDPVASAEEIGEVLEDLGKTFAPYAYNKAGTVLGACGAVDFSRTVEVERVVELHYVGRYSTGMIFDRVDAFVDDARERHVVVVDYKTGYMRPREDLLEEPATAIYLDAIASIYPNADHVSLVYYWPEHDRPVQFRFEDVPVAREIAALEEEFTSYKKEVERGEAGPTLGVHCTHCPYRRWCPSYHELITKPARATSPWEGMPLAELVALRHQVAADAKMRETARKEIDKEIMQQVGDKFDDGVHRARIHRDRMTSYPMSVVRALSASSGVPLEDVVRFCCSVKVDAVKRFVQQHPRAAGAAKAHATPSIRGPYVKTSTHGGMF